MLNHTGPSSLIPSSIWLVHHLHAHHPSIHQPSSILMAVHHSWPSTIILNSMHMCTHVYIWPTSPLAPPYSPASVLSIPTLVPGGAMCTAGMTVWGSALHGCGWAIVHSPNAALTSKSMLSPVEQARTLTFPPIIICLDNFCCHNHQFSSNFPISIKLYQQFRFFVHACTLSGHHHPPVLPNTFGPPNPHLHRLSLGFSAPHSTIHRFLLIFYHNCDTHVDFCMCNWGITTTWTTCPPPADSGWHPIHQWLGS